MLRTAARAAGLAVALAASIGAQRDHALDGILNRLAVYLVDYEAALGSTVATEHYEQQELRPVQGVRTGGGWEIFRRRKLVSDVGFLRLPGRGAWLGVRDVHTVDGRKVQNDETRLIALIKRLDGAAVLDEAQRMVAASSVHNLGGIRTVNMPTMPLDVLRRDHHVRFVFKARGTEKIDGNRMTRLEFEELDVPTLINNPDGGPVFIRGTAWVEPDTGRLWRVELGLQGKPVGPFRPIFTSRLRVDFRVHPDLKILVPMEMSEEFFASGGRGVGNARYSNYRRFTTATRLVPQP